jgi:membrane protein
MTEQPDQRRAETQAARRVPGDEAERPSEIPPRGWWQIVRRAWREGKEDNIALLAAGVAFYGFLALFPALIAAVLVYGLVADPADVQKQVDAMGGALPSEAENLIGEQMRAIASASDRALGIGLVVALLGALWTASGGVNGLITATNIAYDERESRGFLKRRGLALLLTLGALVFLIFAVVLVAVLPVVADAVGLGTAGRILAEAVRWILLVAAVMGALTVIYRVAPDRDAPRIRWTSVGVVTATVVWIVSSVAFSLYVDNFGRYGRTYGSLAGVVVLLLWLYVTAFIVLLGAEINAEAEQQTVRDTTRGEPQPLGQRRAVKADSLPGEPPDPIGRRPGRPERPG